MRFPRLLRGTAVSGIAVLAAIVLMTNGFPGPTQISGNVQQVTITSTTETTVIVIPGFPIESILLGILLGLVMLRLIRMHLNPMQKRIRLEAQPEL